MKKLILSLCLFLSFSSLVHAQWTTVGNNIYNSNTGTVGIGISSGTAKFAVYQSTALGGVAKNNLLLSSVGGSTANSVQNNIWLVRNAAGSDFTTSRLHDGISIDGSYITPQTDTRTWWERDPTTDVQSWGTAANTYLTIKQGNLGLGTVTPATQLHIAATAGPVLTLDKTGVQAWRLDVSQNSDFRLWNASVGTAPLTVQALGNVGIGTTDPRGYKLAVNGSVIATSVTVKSAANWPDYVFQKDYQLPSLQEVKAFIDQNQHLPGIPSAQQIVKEGLDLGEMNKLLMKKVEELTLYVIHQEEEIKKLQAAVKHK